MDHPQRTVLSDSSNTGAPSSNFMPNVLFREIHKNSFLKRHSSDRRTGFPRKSEQVWVVFCVHDDVEPFLEIYPDQKVALTHKPEWFASLSNVLHVSPTICGHEDEFEFAVTLSFQVVRLSAPSWDSMMEWVETIRNKLRELKVLCPKENVYSKMPEQKQPLLPTRDPNSPLPLPPEGPSTLLPGVELVHLENRNGATSNDNRDGRRNPREPRIRNNVILDRQIHKKNVNERNRRAIIDNLQSIECPDDSTNTPEAREGNDESNDIQRTASRVKQVSSILQSQPSTSNAALDSNITVIEVPASGSKENHSAPKLSQHSIVDNAINEGDIDGVFISPSTSNKTEGSSIIFSEQEDHYDHIFLPSGPIGQTQVSQSLECSSAARCLDINSASKPHSTSVLINCTQSIDGSSQNENLSGTNCANQASGNVSDVLTGSSTCVNLSPRNVLMEPKINKSNPISPLPQQIQTKLEKVNISGLIPRVPAKSAKPAVFKVNPSSGKEPNISIVENKLCSNEISVPPAGQQRLPVAGMSDLNSVGSSDPASVNSQYSQVKKVHKVKSKNEELRNVVHNPSRNSSPVLPKRKQNEPESSEDVTLGCQEPANNDRRTYICLAKSTKLVATPKVASNKNLVVENKVPAKEAPRHHASPNPSHAENRNDIVSCSGSSSSGNRVDSAKPCFPKKDTPSTSKCEPDVEPITATVQPAVGVINVEDIPLIGGHQRRRRRSSSSDATPTPNTSSSRVIGGADRIRINVPLVSGARNEPDTRSPGPPRSPADQLIQVSHPAPSSRLTLREQQVLQLKKEMLHPGGVRLQLRRKDCTGSIALVDVLNGVWVAGWKQREHPLLYNALHIGDQLISVSDMLVRTAADAQKLIRTSTSLYVEFIIRRVPFGNVFALQRTTEGQSLGIIQEGNTAEIREVVPNSIAARQGLTAKTPSCDGLSLTTWFLTEINGRPLNLFFKDSEVRDRLNAVGKEISILVQPHDFIKQVKKQLKNLRGYKDYIVQ